VRDHLRDRWDQWNLYQGGEITTEDGQAMVTFHLTRVLAEIAAWAGPLPSGILALKPWLAPLAS
jgi:hypothetical protein